MKANELMIGDWVRHANGTPMQVEKIDYRGFACGIPHCWDYNNIYEPIPITKELLEKNGFVRENLITSYNHYTGIDNRVCLTNDFYSMNSRNMWTAHIDSEDYCTIANCELTYLHELQHLLKLCNIDFEFDV